MPGDRHHCVSHGERKKAERQAFRPGVTDQPGCRDVTHLAWPWLGVVWLLFAAVVVLATSKNPRRQWFAVVALGLLGAAAALGYWHVVVVWPVTVVRG